ncbi:MAG: hypothetical protein LBG19_12505 [Prevotellaceae bacterium]|jgi:hypothetical protein|nr:hypothetical protein [Prevotellaceae bacterium]
MKQAFFLTVFLLVVRGFIGQNQQDIPAEKIGFQMSTIIPMLDFLQDLRNGEEDRSRITEIFSHPDYEFEFRRYGISDKEPPIDYFMHLDTINESEIPTLTPP